MKGNHTNALSEILLSRILNRGFNPITIKVRNGWIIENALRSGASTNRGYGYPDSGHSMMIDYQLLHLSIGVSAGEKVNSLHLKRTCKIGSCVCLAWGRGIKYTPVMRYLVRWRYSRKHLGGMLLKRNSKPFSLTWWVPSFRKLFSCVIGSHLTVLRKRCVCGKIIISSNDSFNEWKLLLKPTQMLGGDELNSLLGVFHKVVCLSHLQNHISKESSRHLQKCEVCNSICGRSYKQCLVPRTNWYRKIYTNPVDDFMGVLYETPNDSLLTLLGGSTCSPVRSSLASSPVPLPSWHYCC